MADNKQSLHKIGAELECINNKPLKYTEDDYGTAPKLVVGDKYILSSIIFDSQGCPHYNVGLVSKFEFVRSFETNEVLLNSGKGGIHWCHPSRFK